MSYNFNAVNINFTNKKFTNLSEADQKYIIQYIVNILSVIDSFHDFGGKPALKVEKKFKSTEGKIGIEKEKIDKENEIIKKENEIITEENIIIKINKENIEKYLTLYCNKMLEINDTIYSKLSSEAKKIIDDFKNIKVLKTKKVSSSFIATDGYLYNSPPDKSITFSRVNEDDFRQEFKQNFIIFIKENFVRDTGSNFEQSIEQINKKIIENFKILLPNPDLTVINDDDIIRCRNILYLLIQNNTDNNLKTILLNELKIENTKHSSWNINRDKINDLKNNNLTYPSSYLLDMTGEVKDKVKDNWKTEKWNFNWLFFNSQYLDPNKIRLSYKSISTSTTPTISKKFTKKENYKYGVKLIKDTIILGDPNDPDNKHTFQANNTAFGDKPMDKPIIEASIGAEIIQCDRDNEIDTIINNIIDIINNGTVSENKVFANLGFKRCGDWLQITQIKNMSKNGYFVLKTGDFWCDLAAVFVGCPTILDDNLYNITYQPIRSNDYSTYTRDRDQIQIYKSIELKNSEDKWSGLELYEGDECKDKDPKNICNEVEKPIKYNLPKGYLSVLINKYLKYKSKYLKQKEPNNINKINSIIKSKRIELYNNINNMNYDNIKQKYLKYKTKYLDIKTIK